MTILTKLVTLEDRETNTYLVWKKWDWDEGEIDQIPYKIWEIRGKAKKER